MAKSVKLKGGGSGSGTVTIQGASNSGDYTITLPDGTGTLLDTTGGTMTGDLAFGDSVLAKFGASNDLQIYHNGQHSYVSDTGTGNLILRGTQLYLGTANGEYSIVCNENGNVDLKYDNNTKLSTASDGVSVTGKVYADGLRMDDGEMIQLGNSYDLEIFHDGSNSYVKDVGVGVLKIHGSNAIHLYSDAGGYYFTGDESGASKIYYSGSAKLATTSNGATAEPGMTLGSRYHTANTNYESTLSWAHLGLGNNGENAIIAGTTGTGGYLNFYVNNTTALQGTRGYGTTNGTVTLTLTSDGRGKSEYTAKAWVCFKGTSTVTIQRSHNVSSVGDNGSGDYTINYTNALGHGNNAISGMGHDIGRIVALRDWTYDTTSWVRVAATNHAGTLDDAYRVMVTVHGDN